MSNPPVPPLPPRPRETNNPVPGPPPPIPPLPPDLRQQTERYNTPSRYELVSPPHFENPLIAPRPHRLDHSIPANMARTLDDHLQKQPSINYTPGFVVSNAYQYQHYQQPPPPPPPVIDITQSIANLSMVQIPQQPQPPPPTKPASPPQSIPSLTATLPILSQLQAAANQIQAPTHDPALKIAWCRDVFFLVDRAQGNPAATDPTVGPVTISDPALARLAQIAVHIALQLASSWSPGEARPKMPLHVAEAIAIRATLATTGSFPEFVRHNPRTAFRDFEAAARGGHVASWFRLGRDYENFNDHAHARECFERGAKLGVESCIYRMGMAHLLGQLSLPQSTTMALPLLNRAALLSSLSTPQPAYVYALLLLSEFTQITVPLTFFAPFIPAGSSPTLEARKHLERAAYLHFPAAQYKLGHAYEFAEPPFVFDPLLSVQYYSLASQQGEVEADMALSKWFLCGSGGAAAAAGADVHGGGFEKDEALALTFAEKAAKNGLPAAEFAMGYYAEVGVGQQRDVGKAVYWYNLAHSHANPDASGRLAALTQSNPQSLSRQEHDTITEAKLVRRRTQAAIRADTLPVSPPWEGTSFPTIREMQDMENQKVGGPPNAPPGPGPGPGQVIGGGAPGRRRQDGRLVVDVIRKNSLASGYGPSANAGGLPASSAQGRMSILSESNSQRQVGQTGRRYDWDGSNAPPASSSNPTPLSSSPQRNASPGRRADSPGRPVGGRNPSPGLGSGLSKLERMRLNLDDPSPIVPSTSIASSGNKIQGFSLVDSAPTALPTGAPPMSTPKPTTTTTTSTPGGGKKPQTFAEMGIHGAKVDDKDCVIM